MKSHTSLKSKIKIYLYIGLAFLLWENLVSSFLGIYQLELRKTIWSVIYYPFVFLVFGGLVEVVVYLISRISPKSRWDGQSYFLLFILLAVCFWGYLSRQLFFRFGNIPDGVGEVIHLSWFPVLIIIGVLAGIVFARIANRRSVDLNSLLPYYCASILYLIVSTKMNFVSFNFKTGKDLLVVFLAQPLIMAGVVTSFFVFGKIFSTRRSFKLALLLVPAAAIILIVGYSAGKDLWSGNAEYPVQPPSDHPNVIIALFDALRADHIGAISQKYDNTPTIDSLAEHSRVYTNCYSVSSWTFTSVVSLMTSRLPNKVGLLNRAFLPDDLTTLASILKENEYKTFALCSNPFITPGNGFHHSFDIFSNTSSDEIPQLLLPLKTLIPRSKFLHELAYQFGFASTGSYAGDWRKMSELAVNVLEKDQSNPFFMYLHYFEPHNPYLSKPFSNVILDFNMLKFTQSPETPGNRTVLTDSEKSAFKTIHERYQMGVQTVDRAMQDLLWQLNRFGLAKNTIIILLSDHGEEFLEHGDLFHHKTLYEEVLKVPLIIYIPPELQIELPEQTANVSLLDIMPTVLDLTGIRGASYLSDGQSLLQPHADRPLFSMLEKKGVFSSAVTMVPHKLILINNRREGKTDTLLFNLNSDPGEKNNLYPDQKYIADSLSVYLQAQLDQTIATPTEPARELSPQEIERLRALGYVN